MAMGLTFAVGWIAGSNAEKQRAYTAIWEAIVTLPDPNECALCGEGMPYHAPCLINLSTGQMGELQVYTQHPYLQGEIAPMEKQQTGTFNFQPCAGLVAIRDTCSHTCEVTLPAERELMNPALFCRECRELLAGAGLEGYAIIDLHDLDNIQAYPVRKGTYEIIRDYRISVTKKNEETWGLCTTGLL